MLPRMRTGIRLLSAVSLIMALSACDKKGTKAPSGKTKEEVTQEKQAKRDAARASGLIAQAQQDIGGGYYVSARKRAEEALDANPEDVDAYAVLGAAAWRAGDFTTSTDAFKNGSELDPKNFGVAIGYARNLLAQGEAEKAVTLQEPLISAEGEGHTEAKCTETESTDDSERCPDGGFCDAGTKTCKPFRQVQPRLARLASQYLLLDVENAVKTGDELFIGAVGAEDVQPLMAAAAAKLAFLRPLAGKGPFAEVSGKGESSAGIDPVMGAKFTELKIGGKKALGLLSELQLETKINPSMAKKLKLKSVGKAKPLGSENELEIVIIPEINIGGLKIKNTPAYVDDLSWAASIGAVPGVSLGRQVMHKIGTITFDFPGGKLSLAKEAPGSAPEGSVEAPLVMLDLLTVQVPLTQVSIDGADHKFWAWLGGIKPAAVAMADKDYLKSNHRPAEIADVDDPDQGLEMVFVKSFHIGELVMKGLGGLVFTGGIPDQGLLMALNGAGFEVGGYVNIPALQRLEVTYALAAGKLYVAGPK